MPAPPGAPIVEERSVGARMTPDRPNCARPSTQTGPRPVIAFNTAPRAGRGSRAVQRSAGGVRRRHPAARRGLRRPGRTHPVDASAYHPYHLRVIAENRSAKAPAEKDVSDRGHATRTARRARLGTRFARGQARQPVEAIRREGGLVQAAANGRAVTYMTTGPVDKEEAEVEGNRDPERSQILSRGGRVAGRRTISRRRTKARRD